MLQYFFHGQHIDVSQLPEMTIERASEIEVMKPCYLVFLNDHKFGKYFLDLWSETLSQWNTKVEKMFSTAFRFCTTIIRTCTRLSLAFFHSVTNAFMSLILRMLYFLDHHIA